jgi:cephalosporin hydroxylase
MSLARTISEHLLPGVDPYTNFPAAQWAGYENTDGSTVPIFERAIDQSQPGIIIEVGTFLGGSALHMAKLCKAKKLDAAIICVDTWYGGFDHWTKAREKLHYHFGRPALYYEFISNVIKYGHQDMIIPLALDSANAARYLAAHGILAQMIYVDGSHEAGDVLRDYETYWPLLASGGALLVDDVSRWFPDVVTDWNRFADRMDLAGLIHAEAEKRLVIKP